MTHIKVRDSVPAGRFLAFVDGSPQTTATRLYARGLADAGIGAITDGRTSAWSPPWSPDGR